ncbi:MAG: acyl-CoA dehydrogenase family protein [Gammaproteobacteria bacterium]
MHDLIDQAIALRPALRAAAARVEADKRIPSELMDALNQFGAFHLQVTSAYGGPGADTMTLLRVIEELSRGDPSTGWCAMVGSESSGCVNAYAAADAARVMLNVGGAGIALTVVGDGKAVSVSGGFEVSGRWRFASNCRNAAWLGAFAVVDQGAASERRLMFFVPVEQARLLDTWNPSGLAGTASDDFELETVHVPAAYSLDLFSRPVDPAVTWRFPVSLRFAMSKAAAMCGIARGAMDLVLPMLERTPFAGAQPARDEPRVHIALAQAEAAIEAGRAYLYQNVDAAWSHVERGGEMDLERVAAVRLSIVSAAKRALEAVDLMQGMAGTAAALDADFDRFVRDINVARHHLQLQQHVVEDVGRVLLGKTPRNPMF